MWSPLTRKTRTPHSPTIASITEDSQSITPCTVLPLELPIHRRARRQRRRKPRDIEHCHPKIKRSPPFLNLYSIVSNVSKVFCVLSNTLEHMKMWKERRSRRMLALINPWAVIEQLKGDRDSGPTHANDSQSGPSRTTESQLLLILEPVVNILCLSSTVKDSALRPAQPLWG